MITSFPAFDLAQLPALNDREDLIRDVRTGLHSRPRSLKPWIFYDEVGSHLFERITTLAEYYPTRTERSLLEGRADAIVATACSASHPLRILELGAGTASKTCVLLAAAVRRQTDVVYMPLDVPPDALEIACRNVECAFPGVLTEPVVVNYAIFRQHSLGQKQGEHSIRRWSRSVPWYKSARTNLHDALSPDKPASPRARYLICSDIAI